LSKHPKNYKKQIDMITKTQRKIKSNFSINNEHLKGTRHHTSKKKQNLTNQILKIQKNNENTDIMKTNLPVLSFFF